MFTYASLILTILKVINSFMDYVNRNDLMQAGADAEIAKTSAAILRKTQAGKAIMEKVDAMSDTDVDAALRDLAK